MPKTVITNCDITAYSRGVHFDDPEGELVITGNKIRSPSPVKVPNARAVDLQDNEFSGIEFPPGDIAEASANRVAPRKYFAGIDVAEDGSIIK